MIEIPWDKFPLVGGHEHAHRWLSGMANRIDSIRGFFCDLIDFEWIEAKFDPRRVLTLPISLRAQMRPNPRIIDDAS
ncbi:hypothetical protein [Dactylosporangium sp. NPDC050588]|uniref:hypothetical protein n=1 Tax=Dactylosporangium sp. NPDC050588 TaxID=3157211 RepID=UPI0033EB2215